MLPVTRQRARHIPHSVATTAAILGLITALGWDVSHTENNALHATRGPLDHNSLGIRRESPSLKEAPEPTRVGRGECDPDVLSGILPLVLPSLSGF